MKWFNFQYHCFFIGLAALILSCSCNSPGQRKSQLQSGLGLSDSLTAVFFLNTDCPICAKYQGTFRVMERQNPGIKFKYIFSGDQGQEAINEYCAYDSIPHFEIVADPQYKIAKLLGAEVTPMALVFKNFKLEYSGKIDDRFENISSSRPQASVNYVNNALFSLSRNEPVEVIHTEAVGCFIEHR